MSSRSTIFWKKFLMVFIFLAIVLLAASQITQVMAHASQQSSTLLLAKRRTPTPTIVPTITLTISPTLTTPTGTPTVVSTLTPTVTLTPTLTTVPTNTPTATPTTAPSYNPTPSLSPTSRPSPVSSGSQTATTTHFSDGSACLIINNSSCMAPAQHAYAAGDLLTISGQNYTQNVTFDLYLLHEQRAVTSHLASLALVPFDQQMCPASRSGLTSSAIAGTYGPWTTTANGSFSAQISLPKTLQAGEVYAACAIAANGTAIEPNQSGSVLLFEIAVKSPVQASSITGRSSFYIVTLSLLGFLFVVVVLLIIFFVRKQSALANPTLAYAAAGSLETWQQSLDNRGSRGGNDPFDTPEPVHFSAAPAQPLSPEEVQMRRACVALVQGNMEPVLALALAAQQAHPDVWEPLMDAIALMPSATTPEVIEQIARDAQARAEEQYNLQDALKALVLYSWLLAGTIPNQGIASIQEAMGRVYTLLSRTNPANATRAIASYKAALHTASTEGDRVMYTWLEYELANAYCKLSQGNEPQEERRGSVLQAIDLYHDALRCYDSWGYSQDSQRVQQSIVEAQVLLAQL